MTTNTEHTDYLEEHLRTLMAEKEWLTEKLKQVMPKIRAVETALHELNHKYLPPEG